MTTTVPADAGCTAAAVPISPMDATIDRAMSTSRFQTLLLRLFATVALLLAMAGVYGLVSFTVSQRTSELGLRIALGAQPREIVALTLSSAVRSTLVGVAIGWVATIALARAITSMLFATSARDPLTFVAEPLLLLAVGRRGVDGAGGPGRARRPGRRAPIGVAAGGSSSVQMHAFQR
jgi:ABC-type antimicrobial peptide transport system permease subunit